MDVRSEAQGLRPRAQEALSDSQLDREIAAAVGIEPSAEFLARVRTRIAAEPQPSVWRLSFEPLWGVAIVGIVLAVVVPQFRNDQIEIRPAVVQTAAREVEPKPFAQSLNSVATAVNTRPVPFVRRPAAAEAPLQLSPVLFSDEERRALARLVMAVQEGLIPPLPETTQANDQVGDVRELRIEPVVIEPLPQLARLEEIGALQ